VQWDSGETAHPLQIESWTIPCHDIYGETGLGKARYYACSMRDMSANAPELAEKLWYWQKI
jgi:hypothetical protein